MPVARLHGRCKVIIQGHDHACVEQVVVDKLLHFIPALRPGKLRHVLAQIFQTINRERPRIGWGRDVERQSLAGNARPLLQNIFARGGRHQGFEADFEALRAPRVHGGNQDVFNIFRAAHRVEADPISHFCRHSAHIRIHRRDLDRDVRMCDGGWGKQRYVEVEVVVIALKLERRAILPTFPDRPDCSDVVAHPGAGSMPRQAETPPDMGAHLSAESEFEPAAAQLLQSPRCLRSDIRAARKGNRHRGADVDTVCSRGGQGQDLEWIVLGLFHKQRVVAGVFGLLRLRGHAIERQGDVGGSETRIEFA